MLNEKHSTIREYEELTENRILLRRIVPDRIRFRSRKVIWSGALTRTPKFRFQPLCIREIIQAKNYVNVAANRISDSTETPPNRHQGPGPNPQTARNLNLVHVRTSKYHKCSEK